MKSDWLAEMFSQHLSSSLDELLPLSIPWLEKRTNKASNLNRSPEALVKLQECWALEEHPCLCECRLQVLLKLCTPNGKDLATTTRLAELPRPRMAQASPSRSEKILRACLEVERFATH